ncbi:hypothetical protein AX16_000922 [Volvariella volvacea WC 439]|nr:hypothetical protein AX16_000922 [Volvariella volvacea WC 439]
MSNPTRHPPFLTPASRAGTTLPNTNSPPRPSADYPSNSITNPYDPARSNNNNEVLFQSPTTPIGTSSPPFQQLRYSSSFDPYSEINPASTQQGQNQSQNARQPSVLASNSQAAAAASGASAGGPSRSLSAVAGPRQPRSGTRLSVVGVPPSPVQPPQTVQAVPQAPGSGANTGRETASHQRSISQEPQPQQLQPPQQQPQQRQENRQSRPTSLALGTSTSHASFGGQSTAYSASAATPTSSTPFLGPGARSSTYANPTYPPQPNPQRQVTFSTPPQTYGNLNPRHPRSDSQSQYQEIPIPLSNDIDPEELKSSHAIFPRPSKPKQHPFSQSFEPPHWWPIIIHVILCLVSYPVILLFTIVARDRSLFWTRFIVSLGCGLAGVSLGMSLLRLGKSYLEASTWATIIHQSRVHDAPGIRLKDLAATSGDPYSPYSGLKLLWDRQMYPGTSRRSRGEYDKRPWALFILFFLLLCGIASALPFIFGRLVDIDATIANQRERYYETVIMGDSSETDIEMAKSLAPDFDNFALTWTMAPFSTHGGLPPVVSLQWENDTVYFSETIMSQLMPNGSGFGTFDTRTTDASIDVDDQVVPARININDRTAMEPGVMLRYPRWGLRVRCAKLTDPMNILKRSTPGNFTYMFVPRDTLRGLFDEFELPFPEALEKPLTPELVLGPGETELPPEIDLGPIATSGAWYDNGVGHSFKSMPLTMGEEGFGWMSVESVIIRVNTSYTPQGQFLTLSDASVPDENGTATHIGYDGAVCLELFEPWVLETYNTTVGMPNTLRIMDKGNMTVDHNSENVRERMLGERVRDPDARRMLNSTNLREVYIAARTNSINQMIKDNGRDAFYVPNPTIISYTGGSGPRGYTELSPSAFAQSRGLADASNMLPYFAGTGKTVARSYPDDVLSTASIRNIEMVAALAAVLLLGVTAGLCVPKLPLSVPRRNFEIYSWLAAFQADELVGARLASGFSRNLELKDIKNEMAELRFRYVN